MNKETASAVASSVDVGVPVGAASAALIHAR
jgi:hypothetical protein